jgi:hypothetical protein
MDEKSPLPKLRSTLNPFVLTLSFHSFRSFTIVRRDSALNLGPQPPTQLQGGRVVGPEPKGAGLTSPTSLPFGQSPHGYGGSPFIFSGGLGDGGPPSREVGMPPNLNVTSLRYIPMTLIDGERPESPKRGSVRRASARTGVRLGWDG